MILYANIVSGNPIPFIVYRIDPILYKKVWIMSPYKIFVYDDKNVITFCDCLFWVFVKEVQLKKWNYSITKSGAKYFTNTFDFKSVKIVAANALR